MPADKFQQLDDARRREYLFKLLCCGTLGLAPQHLAYAGWFSSSSKKLAEDRSIHSLEGEVLVNDTPADLQTRIVAGDRVRTGKQGQIVFAVGADSFLLRGDSEMQIAGLDYFVDSLRILSGRLLSVFGKRDSGQQVNMTASTATIGIRGTGVYVEAEPEQTYVCTCYGLVSLASNSDPDDAETIRSKNHDQPRYIASAASKGSRIRKAPVINHGNEELELLEAIVGRKVPKGFGKQSYRD